MPNHGAYFPWSVIIPIKMTRVGYLSFLRQNNCYYYITTYCYIYIYIYICYYTKLSCWFRLSPIYLSCDGLNISLHGMNLPGFTSMFVWKEGTAESSESEQRSAWMILLLTFSSWYTEPWRIEIWPEQMNITWATAKNWGYWRVVFETSLFFGNWAGAWKTIIHSSNNDNICLYTQTWKTIIHSSKIDDLELYTKEWPWPTSIGHLESFFSICRTHPDINVSRKSYHEYSHRTISSHMT